jgi:hypothetical protein
MKLVIVAVKDRAAECFARPMFVPSTGVAIRSFSDEVNRAADDNQLYAHPDDFDMYELGIFDDFTGQFTLSENPSIIASAKQIKIEKTQ